MKGLEQGRLPLGPRGRSAALMLGLPLSHTLSQLLGLCVFGVQLLLEFGKVAMGTLSAYVTLTGVTGETPKQPRSY